MANPTTVQPQISTVNQTGTPASTSTAQALTGGAGQIAGTTAPAQTAAPEGSLSTTAGALPGTTLNPTQMQTVTDLNVANAINPQLPQTAQAQAVNQQVQSGEMLTQQQVNSSADQVNPAVGQINAATVGNTATVADPAQIQAAQYQAAQVNLQTLSQATQAVTSALPPDALVSNQLQQLLTPDANGNLPSWVQPAVTAANQFLSGRGISNSTMAGQAITAAILSASIPIATSNANAVLTGWQQNLSNQQAAAMQNGQAIVQGMLSNQGAENAALNFNATSTNQTNQFMASLATQVNQFNAAQTNAISQFNASQTQTAETNTAQLQAQLDQFNANMANQREQFNVQNAILVQQSNAEYLRAVNTANTAVQNQDNQLNAQNSMNLSTQAMANLQTQFNDTATMLYNSNMTAEQQNYALTYLSQQYGLQNQLDQNITSAQEGLQLNQQIGTLVGNLFNSVGGTNSLVSGVSNLLGLGGNSGTGSGSGSGNGTGSGSGNAAGSGTGNGSGVSVNGSSGSGNFLSSVGDAVSSAASDAYNWISGLFG